MSNIDIASIQDIGTSKFTPETYKENIAWKKKYLEEKNVRIVTTLLTPICDRIPTNAGVFILEMDCIQNKIEGIGIIINFPHRCEDYGVKIYDNDYYNSYLYYGTYHISREKILDNENNIKPLKYLENLVFKGSTHLKRGGNAMCFSLKKERIIASLPYEEFIQIGDEWTWKNKEKDVRRCGHCHYKLNTKHTIFNSFSKCKISYDIIHHETRVHLIKNIATELNQQDKIPELLQKFIRNKPTLKKCVLPPKSSYKKTRCDSCGEFKKGHICSNNKKHPHNWDIVLTFLRSLFK